MFSLNKLPLKGQKTAKDVLARIRPMIFNWGSLMPTLEVELGKIVKRNSKLNEKNQLKIIE